MGDTKTYRKYKAGDKILPRKLKSDIPLWTPSHG